MRSLFVLLLSTCVLPLARAVAQPAPPAPPVAEPSGAEQLAAERVADRAAIADLARQLDALTRRQAEADARNAAADEEQKKALRHAVSFSAAPGKGLTLTVGDRFSLLLRTRAQIRDTVTLQDDKRTTNELNVKTLRLWLQGYVLTPDLQYVLQLAFGGNDYEKDSSSPIFDAYVEYVRLRDLNIRVGQYFVPFDRARTIRDFGLQLVDRAQLVGELSLDRDVGITLSSQDLGGFHHVFGYAVGLFGGDGRNRFGGAHVGFLYTARFVIRPFGVFDDDLEGDLQRLKRPRLAIGFAGAYNQNTNRQRSTTGATYTLGTYDYTHAAADLVFKYAGFSFLGEFLYRGNHQGPRTAMVNNAAITEYSRSALGFLLQAGYMLHDKVELAARYDDLRAIGNTDPTLVVLSKTTGKEAGGGLNVYLNGHAFKLQADYAYLFGQKMAGGKHVVHVQLDASF